jgi:hypothetical protein
LAGTPREGGANPAGNPAWPDFRSAGFPARLCRISGSGRILKKAGNPAGRISGTSLLNIHHIVSTHHFPIIYSQSVGTAGVIHE